MEAKSEIQKILTTIHHLGVKQSQLLIEVDAL